MVTSAYNTPFIRVKGKVNEISDASDDSIEGEKSVIGAPLEKIETEKSNDIELAQENLNVEMFDNDEPYPRATAGNESILPPIY